MMFTDAIRSDATKVPSISFAPCHLLSLLAVGRMSGLVLDTGHLESTVLPVCPHLVSLANVGALKFY